MVRDQIENRGVKDKKVLAAMLKVKRHQFVPKNLMRNAYQDNPLPIGENQTISQPYIVALMTELAQIKPEDKILEIGTGSGYQTAILAELARKVYSMDIITELTNNAKQRLQQQGYKNIEVKQGDGYLGWPEAAPFDVIIITAAAKEIPQALIKQLTPYGRMIIPIGDIYQDLYLITKNPDGSINKKYIMGVRFVPMVKADNQ